MTPTVLFHLKSTHIKCTIRDIWPQKVIDSHPTDKPSLKFSEQLLHSHGATKPKNDSLLVPEVKQGTLDQDSFKG